MVYIYIYIPGPKRSYHIRTSGPMYIPSPTRNLFFVASQYDTLIPCVEVIGSLQKSRFGLVQVPYSYMEPLGVLRKASRWPCGMQLLRMQTTYKEYVDIAVGIDMIRYRSIA